MTQRSFLTFLIVLLVIQASGQYVLDTPDGRKVKLNSDGTWVYLNASKNANANSAIPKSSTAKYVSAHNKYAIWFDPAQWLYDTTKTSSGFTWDATFYSKDYAITGFCLDSRLAMPVDNLEPLLRPQWQDLGKIKSLVTFKDTINNLPVTGYDLMLELGGVNYQYRGYVHSGQTGSFQFVVGTQKEIFEEDKNKIEQLFKGIIKL